MSKSEVCAECGAPVSLWCHVCGKALCWKHIVTRMLVAHCAACFAKEHGTTPPEQTDNGL